MTQKMTVDYSEELERLQGELAELKDKETEISFQINKAKTEAKETGIFAEPSWFKKATHALRKTRSDIDKLQRAVRLLQKRWNYEQQQTLEYHFMETCRKELDPALFKQLFDKAQYISENNP